MQSRDRSMQGGGSMQSGGKYTEWREVCRVGGSMLSGGSMQEGGGKGD